MNYEKIYNQLIERGKTRKLDGYKEKHHIVPKCIGGSNNGDNIVELTAKEHFICHKLLTEIYPEKNGLHYASWMMATTNNHYMGRDYKIGAREYQRLRESLGGYTMSDEAKRKIGIASRGRIPWNIGMVGNYTFTEETRRKMSEAQLGELHHRFNKHLSAEHIGKISTSLTGRICGIEQRNRMSKSKKGKIMASKKVNQFTKDAIFIKEWDSLSDASRELGIQVTNISSCVKNKRKSAGGFIWELK